MIKSNARWHVKILLLIGCVFIFANSAEAQDKKFYIGLGGSYQLIKFNYEDAVDWDENSWGINAKYGYMFTPGVAFQLDLDWIPDVEGVARLAPALSAEVEVQTAIFSFKGYFPTYGSLKPFMLAGAGIMHYDIDPNFAAQSLGKEDDDDTGACFKVGGGLDFFLNQNVSIGLEANYTAGIDEVKDIEYWNFILGVAYHF